MSEALARAIRTLRHIQWLWCEARWEADTLKREVDRLDRAVDRNHAWERKQTTEAVERLACRIRALELRNVAERAKGGEP